MITRFNQTDNNEKAKMLKALMDMDGYYLKEMNFFNLGFRLVPDSQYVFGKNRDQMFLKSLTVSCPDEEILNVITNRKNNCTVQFICSLDPDDVERAQVMIVQGGILDIQLFTAKVSEDGVLMDPPNSNKRAMQLRTLFMQKWEETYDSMK